MTGPSGETSGDAVAEAVVDADGLTPAWLSGVLGVAVRSVTAERIGTGQTAAAYRLVLDADGPAGTPRTLVAKVAHGAPEARARVADGYRAEVSFYRDVAATTDVRAPRCWHAAVSEDGRQCTLLLEDLSPRRPGVQEQGCSTERAEATVRALAALHAPRWCDPALWELPFAHRPSERAGAFVGRYVAGSLEPFLADLGPHLDPQDVRTLREAAEAVPAWFTARPEPFAVVHGDFRLDNLMFGEDASDVVAVDWQTVTVGPPGRDLGYFLGTSLSRAQRRVDEDRLVAAYAQELAARGVADHGVDACALDYRLGLLQIVLTTVIGRGNAVGETGSDADAMFLAMTRRGCAAIREQHALDLL